MGRVLLPALQPQPASPGAPRSANRLAWEKRYSQRERQRLSVINAVALGKCSRCTILAGPDHFEKVLIGDVCVSCWQERSRGIPDIPNETEDEEEAS